MDLVWTESKERNLLSQPPASTQPEQSNRAIRALLFIQFSVLFSLIYCKIILGLEQIQHFKKKKEDLNLD